MWRWVHVTWSQQKHDSWRHYPRWQCRTAVFAISLSDLRLVDNGSVRDVMNLLLPTYSLWNTNTFNNTLLQNSSLTYVGSLIFETFISCSFKDCIFLELVKVVRNKYSLNIPNTVSLVKHDCVWLHKYAKTFCY